MENPDASKKEAIVFSLEEKFLLVGKEQRIRRRQFFSRIFAPGLILGCAMFVIAPAIVVAFSSINWVAGIILPSLTIIALYYWIILYFLPILITKRCHDFNDSGLLTKRVFIWLSLVFVLTNVVIFCGLFFADKAPASLFGMMAILHEISRYALIVLFAYLLFRPGTENTNDFGDNPANVKIGLIG